MLYFCVSCLQTTKEFECLLAGIKFIQRKGFKNSLEKIVFQVSRAE